MGFCCVQRLAWVQPCHREHVKHILFKSVSCIKQHGIEITLLYGGFQKPRKQ
jgi:hypothetical protein